MKENPCYMLTCHHPDGIFLPEYGNFNIQNQVEKLLNLIGENRSNNDSTKTPLMNLTSL